MRRSTGPRLLAATGCRWERAERERAAPKGLGADVIDPREPRLPIWNNWGHVRSTRQRLHRPAWLQGQRRHRIDARQQGALSRRPGRRARMAISARRGQPGRARRGGAISRAHRGDRPQERARRGAGVDPRLAALPLAAPIRARSLHRAEAAMVSVEADRRRCPVPLRQHGPAGIRSLAMGRLLDAGARGRVFQAPGIRPRAARTREADFPERPAAAIRNGGGRSTCPRKKRRPRQEPV